MSGTRDSIPEDLPTSDDLVAYLDGELDAAARRRLEEQLSTRDELRQRLKEHQQTWDLLDALPRSSVGDGFTRTTVEMIAIRAEEEATQAIHIQRQRGVAAWLLGLAGAVLAAVVGYWMVSRELSRPNEQLMRDLPVIENLDAYLNADSVEFLRALHRERLFEEEEVNAL